MPQITATEQVALDLVRPFQDFLHKKSSGSILLLACTAIALAWANSPWHDAYHHLWETELGFRIGDFAMAKSLHHWINDGLMSIFFFVIGLEIKREVMVGELASMRQAALPLAAAVGGMLVPALLFAAFNLGTPEIRGWGIPMATDIAFALGVLTLLGSRVPVGLKLFLAALAIVDDLGAVLVIALFYTGELSLPALGVAALMFAGMLAANRAGVRYPTVFAVIGFGMWLAVLESGVHATIAGVLGAMAIPARRRLGPHEFARRGRSLFATFDNAPDDPRAVFNEDQSDAVSALERACEAVETPPWVAFVVMPVFALSNAGVELGSPATLAEPTALGILVGLVLGKQVGVFLFSFLAVSLGAATLPTGATWRHIYGVACLCGIGFTMSIFIDNLAFTDAATRDVAKTGILAASLLSGIWGWVVLKTSPAARA